MYTIVNPTASVVSVDNIVIPPSTTLTPVSLSGAQLARLATMGCTCTYIADGTTAGIQTELTNDEATLATKAPGGTAITGGGIATGGGDLTASRVITVPKSTQAQAQAGTDDATAMTPVRVFDAIKALLAGLPTSDPHVVGALWLNSHVLTVSAG